MINHFLGTTYPLVAFVGILTAFALTCILLAKLSVFLPRDLGREFAHDGKLSAGKPRGAGIIFILVFAGATILFAPISVETVIYLILVVIEMFTGYLDDSAKVPWGEYKKGLLDLLVAAATAVTYLYFNSNVITIASLGVQIAIPLPIYGILIMILVWASINVTNCADGVDGLSGTLTIVSLTGIYVVDRMMAVSEDFSFVILLFVVCILGYLWYNATPSFLMMGDAGSRAMGIFISIAVLKTGMPLLFIPAAFMLIIDGGLGLVKVFLLRFLKIHIFKNTRMPLHDFVRKDKGWSNTQTVFRFAIIQIVITVAMVYMLML